MVTSSALSKDLLYPEESEKHEVDWVKNVSACMEYLNVNMNNSQRKELP